MTLVLFMCEDIKEIEDHLNRGFSSLCEWFVENKLAINFGEEKAKSVLFSSKHHLKRSNNSISDMVISRSNNTTK